MQITYPFRLEFDIDLHEEVSSVIIQAAHEMELPCERAGTHIVVEVDSALTAYAFGIRTAAVARRSRNVD